MSRACVRFPGSLPFMGSVACPILPLKRVLDAPFALHAPETHASLHIQSSAAPDVVDSPPVPQPAPRRKRLTTLRLISVHFPRGSRAHTQAGCAVWGRRGWWGRWWRGWPRPATSLPRCQRVVRCGRGARATAAPWALTALGPPVHRCVWGDWQAGRKQRQAFATWCVAVHMLMCMRRGQVDVVSGGRGKGRPPACASSCNVSPWSGYSSCWQLFVRCVLMQRTSVFAVFCRLTLGFHAQMMAA